MTGKERIRKTCKLEPTDKVPMFEQSICSKVASDVMGRPMYLGGGELRMMEAEAWLKGDEAHDEFVAKMKADTLEFYQHMGYSLIRMPWRAAARPAKKIDEFHYLYGDRNASWSVSKYDPDSDSFQTIDSSDRALTSDQLIERLEAQSESYVKPTKTRLTFDDLDWLYEQVGDSIGLAGGAGFIIIPMQPAWWEATALRPDLVGQHLERVTDMNLLNMEAEAQHRIDMFNGGGDLANNDGPVYSPKVFRELMLPQVKRIAEKSHELDLCYFFRTDGWLWPIADMLFGESGVGGYGEIDAQAGMDVLEVKKKFPRLVCWGGMDCGRLLTFGTPQEIADETKRVLDGCREVGGLIFGSSNAIHSAIPTENYLAMIEAARANGC
ncbi:MAG: hypothetical protein GXP25_14460 [Planctomycetes bacterium]|nr:hypothetical protein [Planctomycetota bacterium]